MKTTNEKLTIKEAIEQGYTHFTEEEGECLIILNSLDANDLEYYAEKVCYIVDMSAPRHYTISADEIKDIVTTYVSGQEEMADEDEKLITITESHNYNELAESLNKRFSDIKYYEPTDITLIF